MIAIARDNGYSGVEIRFLRGTVDLASLEEFSPKGIGETKRRFDDAGIEVVGINTGVRMVSLDPAVRAQQMDIGPLQTRYRRRRWAQDISGSSAARVPPEQDREKTLDADRRRPRRDRRYERPQRRHEPDRDARFLLPLARAFSTSIAAVRATSSAFSGIRFTPIATASSGEETWAQLGDRIKLVHVKDAVTATPQGFDFALTGEGTVPVMSFVDLLEREGFDGYVNFEWEKGWHREIAEPEVALPHFARYMAARRP